ncbi:molecular chaperone DnaJ [[Phormidium ambiguum] IAM M-71]|uniref:Molecular chaperone DnaJ n=1 Tax=[Phormidium ambiguum] IAM M-71 TaxID=454136 RepID=A0A1U7IQ66_9CYAN|nr:J domain-containing protein [Phormidium ambiguum]OKH39487.1 molecular chaperone DnaJ [Phormidium ambiguum IAM M-71]
MAELNHYQTLQVSPRATQAEIKQSYRRLAKLFHPDSQQKTANHEEIVRLNVAYEILSDPQQREFYDRQLKNGLSGGVGNWQQRTKTAQKQYQKQRQTAQDIDRQIELWLSIVYHPVNQLIGRIINPIKQQINELSADPFDDELMESFQDYLKDCQELFSQAQHIFTSMPNPSPLAGIAARLYYCLNQVGDGISELETFSLNYDDQYLHTGHEMFRIAAQLRREAQAAFKSFV